MMDSATSFTVLFHFYSILFLNFTAWVWLKCNRFFNNNGLLYVYANLSALVSQLEFVRIISLKVRKPISSYWDWRNISLHSPFEIISSTGGIDYKLRGLQTDIDASVFINRDFYWVRIGF